MAILLSRRLLLAALGATIALPALGRPVPRPRILTLRTAEGRAIAVHQWHAAGRAKGVIVFSHGALSAPWKYDPLIGPWVAAGYTVFAPLHVDSADHPDTKRFTGFMSWRVRIEDMRALSRHIGDRPHIAAGHSFGALVALTLGGAAADVPEGLSGPLNDAKVKAVLAFSPPPPIRGLVSEAGYATLAVPALIQTGTRDVPPGAPAKPDAWRVHLAAYDAAAPGGDRYALVQDGVDHYYGGAICRPEKAGPPQTAEVKRASDLSLLFLAAYGLGRDRAKAALAARLTDEGPDRFSLK